MAWFAQREDGWEAESERDDGRAGDPVRAARRPATAARLFPSLGSGDLAFVLYEPEAGVVRAQRAVRALAAQAVAHGARLVRGRARAGRRRGGRSTTARGSRATRVVWACGGWLGGLFAEHVPLRVTRQELLFFDGGPAWRRPACRAGSTTTARCTARATSTTSA